MRAIQPVDLMTSTWYKNLKAAPKLRDLLLFCLDLADWVATKVLEAKDIKDRVNVRQEAKVCA